MERRKCMKGSNSGWKGRVETCHEKFVIGRGHRNVKVYCKNIHVRPEDPCTNQSGVMIRRTAVIKSKDLMQSSQKIIATRIAMLFENVVQGSIELHTNMNHKADRIDIASGKDCTNTSRCSVYFIQLYSAPTRSEYRTNLGRPTLPSLHSLISRQY